MMNKSMMYVGLDVHKDSTAVAVSEPGAKARFVGTIGPELGELRTVLGKLGDAQDLEIVYEPGAATGVWITPRRGDQVYPSLCGPDGSNPPEGILDERG